MKNIKTEIKWAVLFVIMQLVWMLLEKSAGLYTLRIHKHSVYSNFIAIPAVAFYVFALLEKRSNFYGGIMSYRQAFLAGLMITVFVTLLVPVTQYIISIGIAPEFFPNMIKYSVESGKMTQDAAEKYFNLKNFIVQGVIFTPVMGIVTTLIVAIFVKKQAKQ